MSTPIQIQTSEYHFDDVVVDCENFRVQKGAEVRTLAPRAFDLLVYLIEHRARVVDKQELFEQIWKDTFVTDNALTRSIKDVRRALGDPADKPRYIETIPKRGYRFIAEVTVVGDSPAPAQKTTESVSRSASPVTESQPAATTTKEAYPAGVVPAYLRLVGGRSGLVLWAAIGIGLLVAALIFLRTQTGRGTTETTGAPKTTKLTYSPGLDVYPSISPDGNSVAYSSYKTGSLEIYVKQLIPGSREIQLTSDGKQNLEPAWSPDGRFIAYSSKDRGGIWIMPALGGIARQITEFGSRPAWSRDGSMITFQSEPPSDLLGNSIAISTIWVVPSQAGNAVPVTQVGKPSGGHNSPAWSPDGKRIAFVSYEANADSVLWTVSIESADLRQIAKLRVLNDPFYSPDGEYVYYRAPTPGSNFGLWKVRISPPAGEPVGEPVLVLDPGSGALSFPTMSADGKKIAYSLLSSTSNLWSVPVSPGTNDAAGSPMPITNDTSRRNQLAVFSPDGRKIAYTASRADSNSASNSDIWMVDADGKNPVQLTTDPSHDGLPSWFPQGDRIAFTSDRTGEWALWATSPAGGRETLVLDMGPGKNYMRLSPDGRQVALHIRTDGVVNIWTVGLEGGPPKQLTFDKELMGFPCWSPDGKLLAFEMKRGDDTHIAIVPSNGGTVTQLTFDHGQSWTGDWSRDGDKIAFAGFRNGYWNIWWVSRTTKQQGQITNYNKLNAFVRYPAWSPLGNQIVYEYNETTGNIWLTELK